MGLPRSASFRFFIRSFARGFPDFHQYRCKTVNSFIHLWRRFWARSSDTKPRHLTDCRTTVPRKSLSPQESPRFRSQATIWKPAPRQWRNGFNPKFSVPPDPSILRKYSGWRIPQRLSELVEGDVLFHHLNVSLRAVNHQVRQKRRDGFERPLRRVVPNH